MRNWQKLHTTPWSMGMASVVAGVTGVGHVYATRVDHDVPFAFITLLTTLDFAVYLAALAFLALDLRGPRLLPRLVLGGLAGSLLGALLGAITGLVLHSTARPPTTPEWSTPFLARMYATSGGLAITLALGLHPLLLRFDTWMDRMSLAWTEWSSRRGSAGSL